MAKNKQSTTIRVGKTPRNEISLPDLYFVATDDWIDKLGERAFIAWLKLYSWGKRDTGEDNVWEESRVPQSLTGIRKKLGIGSKQTFFEKVIRPLWNYGLIDLEEYENTNTKGTPPKNIIVYQSPQNKKKLSFEPLEKLRDYDTDYHSDARTFAKKRGNNYSKKQTTKKESKEREEMSDGEFQNKVQETQLPITIQKTLVMNKKNFITKGCKLTDIESIINNFENDLSHNEIGFVLGKVLEKSAIKSSFNNYLQKSLLNALKERNSNEINKNEEEQPKSTEVVPEWFKEQKAEQKAREQENKNKLPTVGDYRNESGEIDIESLLDSFK